MIWRNRRPQIRYSRPPNLEKRGVTVCVATLFMGTYGNPSANGSVALVMADRKITMGDITYEPAQLKFGFITDRALIVIAGEVSIHSEAVTRTAEQVRGRTDISPHSVAMMYGQAMQDINRRHAEAKNLAIYGLNTDSFLAQQNDFKNIFIERIMNRMEGYKVADAEALVIAADGRNAHIIHVDSQGIVSNRDDIGYAAIGAGAWHATTRLAQSQYIRSTSFARSVTETFAAKKYAELAPGVGTTTDAYLVFRDKIEQLEPEVFTKCGAIYDEHYNKHKEIDRESASRLGNVMREIWGSSSSPIGDIVNNSAVTGGDSGG